MPLLVEAGDLIGLVLLEVGYISPQQQEACPPGNRLGEVLVELGYLSSECLEKGLALQSLERELKRRRKLRS
jgi:hypothetical protein